MRNNIFTLPILAILFFSFSANAQWVTNSNGINYNLGNVGIGTSSPTSKLHVDGTGYFTDNVTLADTKKINFADANNYISINSGVLKVLGNSSLQLGTILSGSEQINLYTDDTGNVGIGTSSPSRKFHVVGGAFAVSHSGNQRLEISQDMNSNGTAIFDNQASIGDIKFQMSGSDKFMIARSGNVGIGTSSPLTLLQLRKDIGTAISPSHTSSNDISGIRFTNLSTASNAGIVLNFQLGSTGTSHAAIAASRPSADHNILHFYTEHANSIAERMRINSDGNVGIGTTTPTSKLDIKVGSSETMSNVNFLDGNYRIGSIGRASSTDGIGLFISGYTEASVSTAMPTLVLKGYAKDFVPDNEYDAAVSVRGYNVTDDSELQNTPIFKVLNGHSVAHLTVAASGNVGIGTASPITKLDITGDTFTDHTVSAISIPLRLKNTFDSSSDKDSAVDFVLSRWELGGDNRPETQLDFRLAGNNSESYDQDIPNIDVLSLRSDGKVGIGTTNPDQTLTVKGKIHSEEIIVDLNVPGPDYVFEKDYDLSTLSEIEAFIKANKHLPEVPSAKEMEVNGISLGEMNMLLLKKIEELTLYLIDQNKKIEDLQKEVSALKKDK